jgi:cytochrome c551/c552
MMANASRDPYWQASVRGEVISNPGYDLIIQDKCTTCHTPMARTTRVFQGDQGVLLDEGFLDPGNDLNTIALDGVSCTLCHQIEADGLGEPESFDGHYLVDDTKPEGERLSYGPYEVDETQSVVMKSASGYLPQQGEHIQSSELCASCHTLYTPTVDNNGDIAGLFPEQVPYLEWQASVHADQSTCGDCHMPAAEGAVVLSVTGGPERSPFSIHSFAGGNTYALKLLKNFGEDLNVTASERQIEAALDRALDQLQNQTAEIQIDDLEINGDTLEASVKVTSHVGHKLPTGFPSRRVWIHLRVTDDAGKVHFESGLWDQNGAIFGNANDLDAAAYEPHFERITDPEDVQIYEAIMGDIDGAVTTTLLRGAVYLKDNRLLPDGFNKDEVSEDIAVYGNAASDPDFQGGHDQLVYLIPLDDTASPFTITVELLYQSIGDRWAQNLDRFDAPEPQRFIDFYSQVENTPILVASHTVKIGD